MCLFLTIQLSKKDALRGVAIAKAAMTGEGLSVGARKNWFRKEAPYLTIENGCACHLLEDSADWDAPTWDMKRAELPKLAVTLQQIHTYCSEPFVFEGLRVGEQSQEQKPISISGLVKTILDGKIETRTSYLVQH